MGSRYTTALNLYVHGYERVAATFSNTLRDVRYMARRTLVVAPGGRVIYFLRDEPIPSALEPGIIGTFTKGCPVEVIEDALIFHMRQSAA